MYIIPQFIYEQRMTEEFEQILESEPFRKIVGLAVEHVPTRGIIDAIEQAAVMALRFGLRTQRILARAETPVQRENQQSPN